MANIIDLLEAFDYVLFPVWPVVFVMFLLLAVRDIVRQKDAGFWIQKAIVAAVALMIMTAPLAGLLV